MGISLPRSDGSNCPARLLVIRGNVAHGDGAIERRAEPPGTYKADFGACVVMQQGIFAVRSLV